MTLNHKIYELLSKNPDLTSSELGAMAKYTASNAKMIKFRLNEVITYLMNDFRAAESWQDRVQIANNIRLWLCRS